MKQFWSVWVAQIMSPIFPSPNGTIWLDEHVGCWRLLGYVAHFVHYLVNPCMLERNKFKFHFLLSKVDNFDPETPLREIVFFSVCYLHYQVNRFSTTGWSSLLLSHFTTTTVDGEPQNLSLLKTTNKSPEVHHHFVWPVWKADVFCKITVLFKYQKLLCSNNGKYILGEGKHIRLNTTSMVLPKTPCIWNTDMSPINESAISTKWTLLR